MKNIKARLYLLAIVFVMPTTLQAMADGKERKALMPNIGIGTSVVRPDSIRSYSFNIGVFSNARMVHGAQLGALTSVTDMEMRGLNFGGVMAYSGGESRGFQFAGAANITNGNMTGMQMSGVMNVANGISGVQLAPYNFAQQLTGVQIGAINAAAERKGGWQIGLVNFSRDTIPRKIGLINVNMQTQADVLFFGGNSSKMNGAIRFRNRHTYSMIGSGVYYMGFDEKFSGTVFYRFGYHFPLSPRWTLSADLGYYHIEAAKENSREKPTRLRSIQAHANIDYKINKTLGAFISTGYGEARRYGSNELFRRRLLLEGGLAVRLRMAPENIAQPAKVKDTDADYQTNDTLKVNKKDIETGFTTGETSANRFIYDRDQTSSEKRATIHPAILVTGINLLVHSFDRFVLNEDFAKVTFKDIGHNFKHAFVWDNDQFSTNLFAHPYHGNLYFNAARSNGCNFWQAAPYALGGSLMWEFLGEVEPPAINDLIATTVGGIAIGEVMHRVSSIILNDNSRGFRRFLREFSAAVVNPMRGFTRLVNGEAWRVRSGETAYHDFNRIPVQLSLSAGTRYLADDGGLFRGEQAPYIDLYMEYGDPFDEEETQPYDYFIGNLNFSLSRNQPLINRLHLLGRLWSAPVYQSKNVETLFGVFQHFNYYDSKPVKNGTSLTPYRISEAAALGPGLIYRFGKTENKSYLEQRVFLAGILLGGTKSDYYNIIDRDYNMGSGYSIKSNSLLVSPNGSEFAMNVDYYRIYTWKGYEKKDLTGINPIYLNSQGDKSNAELLVLNPRMLLRLKRGLAAQIGVSYFIRNTRYKFYEDVRARTFEFRAGLAYRF